MLVDAVAADASGYDVHGPAVDIDASTLYELLLSLLVFGYGRDGHALELTTKGFAETRARADPEVVAAFDDLAPSYWFWHGLLFLACQLRSTSKALHAPQFVEHLRSMDPLRLYDYLLGSRGRSGLISTTVVRQAAMGDVAARRRIGKAIFDCDDEDDAGLVRFLSIPPPRVKDLLLRILMGWYFGFFRADERELGNRLANEARTKRTIGRSSATRLLRAAAIGVHYLPRKAVKRVVLIPSIACGPSLITMRFGSTRMFFYPLPEEASEEDQLPSRLLKMHRALADPKRLRILRLLIRGERTPESLSLEFGEPPATLIAELIILRDAGLVMLRMDERRLAFEIRHNLPSVVFRNLQSYLPEPSR